MSMQKRKFTKEEKLQILEERQNQWGKKPHWRSTPSILPHFTVGGRNMNRWVRKHLPMA